MTEPHNTITPAEAVALIYSRVATKHIIGGPVRFYENEAQAIAALIEQQQAREQKALGLLTSDDMPHAETCAYSAKLHYYLAADGGRPGLYECTCSVLEIIELLGGEQG